MEPVRWGRSTVAVLLFCLGCFDGIRGQQLPYQRSSIVEDALNTAVPSIAPPPPPMPVGTVTTTVKVDARLDLIRDGLSVPHHVLQSEVLSSAGTWGDFTRYLQLLPGVVWTNDFSNEILVRGGNSDENLYVVDGIEVPNINHFALAGSTGGFASMVDTSVVESVDMKPGIYDPAYSRRLSSMVDIHTLTESGRASVHEMEAGISGAGGLIQRPLPNGGSVLLSAHRSVLNYMTSDIGVNGVPIYTNGFAKADWAPDSKDQLSLLDISGADSIDMNPQPCDPGVTWPIRTQYGGLRSTDGLNWQRFPSSRSSSAFTFSYSFQNQDIGQQWQTAKPGGNCLHSIKETPVYTERTHDGIGTTTYRYAVDRKGWVYSMGATARLVNLNYVVAQPLGGPSPFSADPAWTDSDQFSHHFSTGEFAGFLEANGHLGNRWTAVAAIREEHFGLTGSKFLSSQGSLAFRISQRQTFNVSVGRSAQLPPTINILSYAQNRGLALMQADQISGAAELWHGDRMRVSVESYLKRYTHEPVSTEYPSLMLANMVDTLGQQFIWLPLRSGGYGRSEGVELTVRAHTPSRISLLTTASYSRTRYAAADGVMRPGNFDFPLVLNAIGNIRIPWRLEVSVRNSFASGRPYTPFNIALSEKQSRGIYDLSRINGMRAPAYNRLDSDINRDFHLAKGVMNVHAGVENAFDRQNFLGYVWMDSCHPHPTDTKCGKIPMVVPGVPVTQINQMGVFPSAWVHYRF